MSRTPVAHPEPQIHLLLERVEEELQRIAAAAGGVLGDLAGHIFAAGGKRLRPRLVILGAGTAPPAPEAVVDVALAAELVHTASLVHDDVIDDAHTRRGRATVNERWGNRTAVLAGDFLFARAFDLLARHRQYGVVELMTGAIAAMCQGEIEQAGSLFDCNITEDAYLARIRKKTACLFGACCRAGAALSAAAPPLLRHFYAFGVELGLAFQITDDILDLSADPVSLGKPVGNDLAQGVLTLPVIRALQDGYYGPRLRRAIERRRLTPAELDLVREALEVTGALAYAYRVAAGHLAAARRHLEAIPDGPRRQMLLDLAEKILARKS